MTLIVDLTSANECPLYEWTQTGRSDTVRWCSPVVLQTRNTNQRCYRGSTNKRSRDKPACNTRCHKRVRMDSRALSSQQKIGDSYCTTSKGVLCSDRDTYDAELRSTALTRAGKDTVTLRSNQQGTEKHAGIGIQRCCRNKMSLPLAIDTQVSLRRCQARTLHVCTNCVLDAYLVFLQCHQVDDHEKHWVKRQHCFDMLRKFS